MLVKKSLAMWMYFILKLYYGDKYAYALYD